jgi:hypothetical protein
LHALAVLDIGPFRMAGHAESCGFSLVLAVFCTASHSLTPPPA